MKREAMLMENAPHKEITYKIIGATMAVHNDLGPGHREEVYQRALAIKLLEAGLSFQEQLPIEICNENGGAVGLYNPDYIVEEKVITEIKAHSHPLTNDDLAQVIDYFAGPECQVALLFNFGRPRLEFKRLFPPKKIKEHRRKKWGNLSTDRTTDKRMA